MWIAWLIAAAAGPDSILNSPSLGDQYETARSIGMGGAQRGIADQLDAIYVNPAGMVAKKQYIIGGNFAWQQDAKVYQPSIAIIDSATTSFAAGLSYGYERRDSAAIGVMNINRVALALAYDIGGYIAIGITGKYLQYDRDHPFRMSPTALAAAGQLEYATPNPAVGGVAALGHIKSNDTFTGDLGIMVTPLKIVTISLVGYNLIPLNCKDFPGKVPQTCPNNELAPLGMAAGIGVHIMGLEADADVLLDFWSVRNALTNENKIAPRFHFGGEYTIASLVPVRAGFIVDNVGGDNLWTVGGGFVISQFGFDVGYRQAITQTDNRTVAASLRIMLQ